METLLEQIMASVSALEKERDYYRLMCLAQRGQLGLAPVSDEAEIEIATRYNVPEPPGVDTYEKVMDGPKPTGINQAAPEETLRDRFLSELRAENERLKSIEDNYFYGRGRISRQAEIDVVRAEVRRLREALEKICKMPFTDPGDITKLARAALSQSEEE
jgi:hypothetical protein